MVGLENILRKAVEDKRQKLIPKLIISQVYDKDDQNLYALSLSDLEYEYWILQSHSHIHHKSRTTGKKLE